MDGPELMEMPVKAFGIGSFNFGINESRKNTLSIKQYMDEVKTTLNKIPSIEKVLIECHEDNEEIIILGDEQNRYPHLTFLKIDFILHISGRVQCELVGYSISDIEKFKVTIQHNYYYPIAFVECINAKNYSTTPADGVRIVREFLKKEFPKTNSFITFEYLGPAPFHAEFYIEKSEVNQQQKITSTETERKGYNKIIFYYDENKFEDIEDAMLNIYEEIESEVGVFYKITYDNSMQMKKWEDITLKILNLMDMENNSGIITKAKNKFYSYQERNKILQELYLFKAEDEIENKKIERTINSEYEGTMQRHLQNYIKKKKSSLEHYPTSSVIEWLKHKEDNSIKIFDIVSRITTAILGGIIGGLITYSLK